MEVLRHEVVHLIQWCEKRSFSESEAWAKSAQYTNRELAQQALQACTP
jgi:hypothetical protein